MSSIIVSTYVLHFPFLIISTFLVVINITIINYCDVGEIKIDLKLLKLKLIINLYTVYMTDKVIEIEEKYRDYCENNPDTRLEKREYFRLHVLNEKNKLVDKKFINNIFKEYSLNHKVKNLSIYQEALVHDSYLEENLTNHKFIRQIKDTPMIRDASKAMPLIKTKSYQRLEYFGDAVIHIAAAKYLFYRYPNEDEGFLTKVRTRLENGKEETKFCRCLGLHEYGIIARNMELTGGRLNNYKVLEDLFEAFIGALATEISIDKCIEFVVNIIEKEADIADMICYENNYKGKLMKECHKEKWEDIEYIEIDNEDNEDKKFRVKAMCGPDDSKYVGYGKGKSKRDAQQKAAKEILIKLGQIINDNIDDDNDIFGEYNSDGELELDSSNETSSKIDNDGSDDIYGEYDSDN